MLYTHVNLSNKRFWILNPNDTGMHHGMCVTHLPWCLSGSLTRGGGENVPGIPPRMHNPLFYVSGKRSMAHCHSASVTKLCWRDDDVRIKCYKAFLLAVFDQLQNVQRTTSLPIDLSQTMARHEKIQNLWIAQKLEKQAISNRDLLLHAVDDTNFIPIP